MTFLQTIIPAIEGLLLSPHDKAVLDLLYQLSEYHSLAKLRMHTETTLQYWEQVIISLTHCLREFQHSSQELNPKETPTERNTRVRRTQKRQREKETTWVDTSSQVRTLNLNTYKFHAICDGPASVRQFGTLDSYSTQIVSTVLAYFSTCCSHRFRASASILYSSQSSNAPVKIEMQHVK